MSEGGDRDPRHGGKTDRLLIDVESTQDLLVTDGGAPVWPAALAEDFARLECLAEAFGSRLERVRGRPGRAAAADEVVVALGEETDDAARLYAHLTGRQFAAASRISQLRSVQRLAIVVTTFAWLDDDLFDALYPGGDDDAPGILCGLDARHLRDQVLTRSAAAILSGRLTRRRVDFLATTPVVAMTEQDHTVVGERAPAGFVRRQLGESTGILTVVAHSDGVDACLGPSLTLCPVSEPRYAGDFRRANRCQTTSFCHRLSLPLDQARRTDALVSPEEVRARVLLWEVCWGVLPAGTIVDAVWGLGPRLLASPHLGAIVTSWRIQLVDFAVVEPLIRDLSRGATVGWALGRFLRRPETRRRDHRLCLFGDPRVCLPAVREPQEFAPMATPASAVPSRQVLPHLGDVAFLKAYLERARSAPFLSGGLAEEACSAHIAARRAVEAYECSVSRGHDPETGPDPVGPALRDSMLDFVVRRGPAMLQGWTQIATLEDDSASTGRTCPACLSSRHRASMLRARFYIRGLRERRVVLCPRCGIVSDQPADCDVRMKISEEGIIQLAGDLPRAAWSAKLVLKPQRLEERVWWAWPQDDDGGPRREACPGGPWPTGPVYVAVVFMWGAQVLMAARSMRRDFPGRT